MLSVSNISKTFDRKPVLKNISFTQDAGETIVFMGRNGVGKTTLFRIIAGLMTCDKGSILFNGNDLLYSEPFNRKKLFYIGHAPGLYYAFSALENIKFAMSLRGVNHNDSAIEDVLSQFGLSEQKYKPIGIYSAGMLQRLKISLAHLLDWDLLLIDEPFSGLDNSGENIVNEKIFDWKKKNKTIAMILHDKNQAKSFADRILNISSGVIENS